MPVRLKLHCDQCNHVWEREFKSYPKKAVGCPECAEGTKPLFPAPNLGRGAAPDTRLKIPENKTKAIDQAMRWASEDNGGVNIRTDAKPGESVAMPVPTDPRIPQQLNGFVGANGSLGNLNIGGLDQIRGRIPNEDKARNLGILGGMQKKGNTPMNVVAASSMKGK